METTKPRKPKLIAKRKLSIYLEEGLVRRLFHERAEQRRPVGTIVEDVLLRHFDGSSLHSKPSVSETGAA